MLGQDTWALSISLIFSQVHWAWRALWVLERLPHIPSSSLWCLACGTILVIMIFKFVGAKWKLSMKFDHQISWVSCTSDNLLHIRLSLLTDSLCPSLVVCSVINILTLLWEPRSCSTRTKTTNGLGKESNGQDNGTHTGENVTSGMMIFL